MTGKILFVDDDESLRILFRQAYGRGPHTVFTAETAEAALQILEKETFQIMFFDLQLPGMSGVRLCKKVRNQFPEALIVAITGHPKVFELADCRKAGFDHYLTKPFDKDKVRGFINRALGEQ